MKEKLKIIHNSHSGRLRPHEHTSYITLFVVIFFVGILLVGFSISSYVSAAPPPPQAESVGLTGIMPADPPTVGATIDTPKNQQHFNISPITVAGTCPLGTLVEIFKNNIFAGSTPCETGGNYSLQIDLLYGQNQLFAQVYDALNQAGPPSASTTVFYDASPAIGASLSFLNFGGSQLLLNTDAIYRGTFPGQELNVPLSIIGGAAPFAINVEWGDSNNNVIPRSDNSVFNATHTYEKAGTYKVTFQASDSQQQAAFLAVAVVVNGQPAVLSSGSAQGKTSLLNKLLVLWPLYAVIVTLVTSFWLGERHEKKLMLRHGFRQQQTPIGTTPHLSL